MQNNYGLQLIDEKGKSIFNPDTLPFIFYKKITFNANQINGELIDLGLKYGTNLIYFIGCRETFLFGGAQVYDRLLSNGNCGIGIATGINDVNVSAILPNYFFVYVFYQDVNLLKEIPKFGLAIFDVQGNPIYHTGKKTLKAHYINYFGTDTTAPIEIKPCHAALSSVISVASYVTMQNIPNRLVVASYFLGFNVWVRPNNTAALMPARIIVDIKPVNNGGTPAAKISGNVSKGAFIINMDDYD